MPADPELLLYRAVTGRPDDEIDDVSVRQAVAEIEASPVEGLSGKEAARFLGVHKSTWNKYRAGKIRSLKDPRPKKLDELLRRARLKPGREQYFRAREGKLWIDAEVRVSSNQYQPRGGINLGKALRAAKSADDATNDIINAYLSGKPGAMTGALEAAIDRYVPGMRLVKLDAVRLGNRGGRR